MPTQALFFLNDPFVHAKAEKCAARLQRCSADEAQRIELAWRLAIGRAPPKRNAPRQRNSSLPTEPNSVPTNKDNVEAARLAAFVRAPVRQQRIPPRRLNRRNETTSHFDFSRRGFLRSLVGGSLLLPGIVSQLLAEEMARSGRPR